MTSGAGEKAVANADEANQHYEACLAELEKWKSWDPGPLRDNDPEQQATFSQNMRSTVEALDDVIAAAESARNAEEIAIKMNFKVFAQKKRLRESRQTWTEVMRQYRADRRIVSMFIQEGDESA
jgi:hypothetical protein